MVKRISQASKPKVNYSGVHAHGCVTCKGRFEDACGKPKEWPECADCRTGRPVRSRLLIESRNPIACCRENTRPIRDDERYSYRLYQDCPWFVCPTCSRTFPFRNPKESHAAAP